MNLSIAYIANGKLHIKTGDEPPRLIESKFGQKIVEQAIVQHQRNAWKAEQREDAFISGSMLWGRAGSRDPAKMRIAITSLTPGLNPGDLLYTLDTDHVSGVFAIEEAGAEERRLAHHAGFNIAYLHHLPGQDLMACSVRDKLGASHIAVMKKDGSDLSEVTEGDSIDLAPRWVPGQERTLIFQSAGVGRDKQGHRLGQSPFSIQKLNLESGEMECLAGDPNLDFLGPQMMKDGTLYYIQRPYEKVHSANPLRILFNVLMIPFRLIFALFQWLNWFNVRYTGKTLTTTGDVKKRQQDIRQMMIWGNLIQAEKDAAKDPSQDSPDLVPKSWQLMRTLPQGEPEIVARGTLSFDLGEDDSVVYSNGSAIYRMMPDGKTERILKDNLIEQVVVIRLS